MTATNHVLTGVVIAAAVPYPLVALPLAFLAHFALDALPHYGDTHHREKILAKLKYILAVDMTLAALILLALVVVQPANWAVLVLGGILCASPDLMWFPNYVRYLLNKPAKPSGIVARFHTWIQWGERPWGIWVELVWFVLMAASLSALV